LICCIKRVINKDTPRRHYHIISS